MAKVILKYKRTTHKHPWIKREEIKEIKGDYNSGDIVHIFSCRNEFIGTGYINESSRFFVRIFSTKREGLSEKFFKTRIYQALERRGDLFKDSNAYRLLYSEADKVPGLIVDVYNDVLVLQINTLGMDKHRENIVNALVDTMRPAAIYEKSTAPARKKEGLELKEGWLVGRPRKNIEIKFNGLKFWVDVENGQKTGFYLDQRDNARILAKYVKKGMVCLDLFCYEGTFTLGFLKNGAQFIDAVDTSAQALELLLKNIELNGLSRERVSVQREKAFQFLHKAENVKQYDLIVMDPPPFASTRRTRGKALSGYKELVRAGMNLIKRPGIFAFSTCSQVIKERDIERIFKDNARLLGCRVRLLEIGNQPKDHPVIKHIPQTRYLNFLIFEVK